LSSASSPLSSAAFASSPDATESSADPESDESVEPVAPVAEPASDAPEVPSCAQAIPGLLAIATPIPSVTANAPTLPMNRPYPVGVVAKAGVLP
jgi:hypothetical protein